MIQFLYLETAHCSFRLWMDPGFLSWRESTVHYLRFTCCTDLLPSTERMIERDTERQREYKTSFFLFTRVLLRVSPPPPLISFRHAQSSPLVSVCGSVAKSICLLPTGECVCVCVCIHVCVLNMRLLVFFSRGKVELHGFVHLPVLFTDQLQREGTV